MNRSVRDRVRFKGSLHIRIESPYFQRRRIAIVRTNLAGYAGCYLLVFNSDSQADRFLQQNAAKTNHIVAAAFPFLDRGVRMFFFTRMSACFRDLGTSHEPGATVPQTKARLPEHYDPRDLLVAVDLHEAATRDSRPVRVFMQADSGTELAQLEAELARACRDEQNNFKRVSRQACDELLDIPRVEPPPPHNDAATAATANDAATHFGARAPRSRAFGRRVSASSGKAPDTATPPDDAEASADYTPFGHQAFPNQYVLIISFAANDGGGDDIVVVPHARGAKETAGERV